MKTDNEIVFINEAKSPPNCDAYEEASLYINSFFRNMTDTEIDILSSLTVEQIKNLTDWKVAEAKFREAEKVLMRSFSDLQLDAVTKWMRNEVTLLMKCPREAHALEIHTEYMVERLNVYRQVSEQLGELVKA